MNASEHIYQLTPDRRKRLKIWMILNDLNTKLLALRVGVGESMMSSIVSGAKAPAERIEQLAALGIPRDFLPEPAGGRGGRGGYTLP